MVDETLSPKNEFVANQGMPGVPLRDTSASASLQDTNIALRPPTAEELPVTSQGPPDQAQGLNGATQPREVSRFRLVSQKLTVSSLGFQRAVAWDSESIPGDTHFSSSIYVQRSRSEQRVQPLE